MSKFQVITFSEFTEEEIYEIAIGIDKNFGFNNKKVLEDLIKFHKKCSCIENIKECSMIIKIRERIVVILDALDQAYVIITEI